MLHVPRGDQVGLLDEVEQEIVRPRVVLETRVARIRYGDRRQVLAEHLHPARLPQLRIVEPHVHRMRAERHRVGEHANVKLHVGLGDAKLVAGRARLRTPLREIAENPGRALGNLMIDPREVLGFGGLRKAVHLMILFC